MLDYGFASSPGGPCSDFQGRGRHGRGITSRALIGEAEYSHFFLNPLAVGSHEEGLPIPHAGAASLCPETAFHNPLAKEYDSDDDLTDSPPDSPEGAMLSFLSFPRAYDFSTNGAKFLRPPSSSNKNANTISYNKGPISLAHRKVNVHSTGVALSSTMGRTAPVKNGSSPQRMEVNGPISGAKPLAEPTPPELKPQLGSLEPSVERPSLPSEPHAPHTPPLISRDATAATAPWRWCQLGFPDQQQEDQQRRQYDEIIPDQPEQSAAGAALHSNVSIDGTGAVTQVQEDEGQKLLQLDKEEHWLPLVPRNGETPVLPQTPQLQDQPQRLLPKHCAPSHAPTEAPCSSVTPLTRFASGCAHAAAAAQSQVRHSIAAACDASFTATAAVVGSCGSSSSSQATPARPNIDTTVTVVSSPNASCTPGALGATSSSPTNNAKVAKREVGLGHFSFGRHSSAGSNGHNSRWAIVDGPPCSISGLAMTRAIIRQLGLLPPGLSTAPA